MSRNKHIGKFPYTGSSIYEGLDGSYSEAGTPVSYTQKILYPPNLNIYFLSVTPPHTHTRETPEFMVYKGRILSVLLITAAPALILMPGIFDHQENDGHSSPSAKSGI